MILGLMDRRIEFQAYTPTTNTAGGDSPAWFKHIEVWAQAKPMKAAERFEADQFKEIKTYTFIIRYRRSITSDMRILFNGEYYRILGLAELGRREGLEITAEYMQRGGEIS